jgi:Tfp pilus assembly protein PilZ
VDGNQNRRQGLKGQWRQTATAATAAPRDPRVKANVAVRVSTVDPELDPTTGKHFFRSAEETTANLSHGGAFIRSMEPLEAGRRVLVELDVPQGGRLTLLGQVAWTQRQLKATQTSDLDGPGFGIQFIDASSAERARLDRYLGGVVRRTAAPRSLDSINPPA